MSVLKGPWVTGQNLVGDVRDERSGYELYARGSLREGFQEYL